MIPGASPTTCPIGRHDSFWLAFKVLPNGNGVGARLDCLVNPYYANSYYALECDGKISPIIIYAKAGEARSIDFLYDQTIQNHVVSLIPLGKWDSVAGSNIEITIGSQQDYFTSNAGLSSLVTWNAVIDAHSLNDSGQLTNWVLQALNRYQTGYPVTEARTQLQVDLTLSTALGVSTLTLNVLGVQIAQGSITGNGTINLSALNGSGVAGTVILNYTGDLAQGKAYVRARWPLAYKVYVDSALKSTVQDTGRADRFSAKLQLSSGVHNIQVSQVSDSGVESPLSNPFPLTIPGIPNPPSVPTYSGTGYNYTVLSFNSSSNAALTNIYDSDIDGILHTTSPVLTISGLGKLNTILPAIPANTTGIRRVALASQDINGVNDLYWNQVNIEYLSGNIITPRPNIPSYSFQSVQSGARVNFNWVLNTLEAKTPASKIQLFLQQDGISGVDYTRPVSSVGITGSDSLRFGTISGIPTVSGNIINSFFYASLRTINLSGVQSNNTDTIGPFWLSNVKPLPPINIDAKITY